MSPRRTELDPVLEELKPLGKYQVLQTLLYFISYFSCSYSLFSIVFTGQKVGHKCAPAPNITTSFVAEFRDAWDNGTRVHYGKCGIDVTSNVSGEVVRKNLGCFNGMLYDKPRDFSIITEFDLVCDRSPLASLSQTLLMLGQGFGALLFTALSDRFGRKRINVITHVLLMAGGVAIGFAPDYVTFAIFKLFVGATQQGVVLTTVTANVESFPRRYRGFVAGFVGALWWAIVTSSLTAWVYPLRHFSWRVVQLAVTSVGLVVILQIIFMREPMRWLLANGRTHEVVEQLRKAAKMNKRSVQEVLDLFHRHLDTARDENVTSVAGNVSMQRDDVTNKEGGHERAATTASLLALEAELEQAKAEKLSFLDLLRHRRLRINSLCIWAVWFTNSLTFFALILMSGSLTNNIYLSFFLNIAVEIPAAFVFMVTVDRIGRRRTLLMFHSIAAVSLLTSAIMVSFTESSTLQLMATVMSLVGKFGISGSFNCVFFFTPEIFPTNIRNLAIGTGSTAARIGGMIAPFIGLLKEHVVWAPGVLFGTCNLLILIVIRLLPDSMGRELPQTLRDLEAWYEEPEPEKSGVKAKGIAEMHRMN